MQALHSFFPHAGGDVSHQSEPSPSVGGVGTAIDARVKDAVTSPRLGRPRNPHVDRAILDAARQVLAVNGYTGTSMGEIARRAGVGKDTLYRRWSSKAELVLHLLTVLAEESVPVPAEDDPSYALFLFLQDIVRVNTESDFGAIVSGLVGESARSDELADGFRSFWAQRRLVAATLVREITGSGPTDREIERILDHVIGPIYYRLLLTGSEITEEYLWDLVLAIPQSFDETDALDGQGDETS